MFQGLKSASSQLLDQIISITWFMRGGLDYEYAFNLTPLERERMSDFVEDRMSRMENGKMVPIY